MPSQRQTAGADAVAVARLREACEAGVEVIAYRAALAGEDGNPSGRLELVEEVPVSLEP